MRRTFDESLQDILQSMLSVCLEFIGEKADAVYLHCSVEEGMSSADVFFDIDGALRQTHELDTADAGADTFDERLSSLLGCLLDDLDQLIELHEGNGREAPTEMRLHYDVVPKNLSVSFSYERKFSHSDTLLPSDVFDVWYEEVKSQRQTAG